ncbi:uncharacterized protein LOC118816713 [Colossoma macropomum]|uniref:uncharacterized protein LOC118816713 n=1 Tax=Colossoma macropomum TaxID=42526 RepID=UPI00186468F6|nr:uncharacterized protein LOC118816713 [Colossoma macropomum]
MRPRAEVTLGDSTLLALKVTGDINVRHLTTLAPQMISTMSTPMKKVIRAKLGRAVYLPCQCGRFNVGGNNTPKWKNSRGEYVLLTGPEVDTVSHDQRKYLLYNDKRWLKVRDDCSLVVRNVTWEDQGEYTCTYLEPEFKFIPFHNVWREGYITHKEVVVIKDFSSTGVFMVTKKVQERFTTATTPRVNIALMKLTTLPPETTTAQRTILDMEDEFFYFDWTPEDMTDHHCVLQKRETKWKAYGFDSSVLQIADPWAGRDLWFQQLTHSVRSVRKLNCPCVGKVPTPVTWPSILEMVPEQLSAKCQSYALSWLLYQQQSAEDKVMALSVHLFRPKHNCSWLRELSYVNLLDQHENMIAAIPVPLEVKSVGAKDCFFFSR